ncbi:MAG: hypothetical protein KME50_38280 [Nostoc desertorum CM1-VF14]|nr:hypothetical protein [Nostoc desertorum CM1-VF14]
MLIAATVPHNSRKCCIDKLSLYLCRQIVEAHKGTINAESIPDEGTIFWFTLPIISLKN